MSDARIEYEAAMDTAIAVLGDDCRKAYGAFEQSAEQAWYTYQIRAGMIPAPDAVTAESESGNGEGRSSGSAGNRDDSSADGPAGTVGSPHTGEGDQGGPVERNTDGSAEAPVR